MRLTLALMLAVGLLAAPVAAAAGPSPHAAQGQTKAAERTDAATDAGGNAGDGPAIASSHHDKTKFQAWHAALKALLSSWKENASAIRERCNAAERPDNATQDQQAAWAHCIRDGYKAFLEQMRADMRAARAARSE